MRPHPGRSSAALAREPHRAAAPARPGGDRSGEHRDRRGGSAPRRRVRRLPLRDRGSEAATPHLEERAASRRIGAMGGPPRPTGSGGSGMSDLVRDTLARPLGSLRVSVTDRCNLRCRYCMPEEEYVWLPKSSILSFEEIARIVGVFAGLGARKLRLTGGEPLLRHDLPTLVGMLTPLDLSDLAMTTNGLLLAKWARSLRDAGLRRVTVSLDTLRPERMQVFTRSPRHAEVLEGIAAARAAGFDRVKLNTVVIRGFNEDELADLLEFARTQDAEVRFIEYMDVGGATHWSREQVVSQREILDA